MWIIIINVLYNITVHQVGHLPRDVYGGLTAAVMDINTKLQFVRES
jgi:hypothetical protein